MDPGEHCSKTMKGRSVGFRRRQDQVEFLAGLTVEERVARADSIRLGMSKGKVPVLSEDGREGLRAGGRKGGAASAASRQPRGYECSVCGDTFYRCPARGTPLCPKCKTEIRICPVCDDEYIVERKNRRLTCSRACGQKMRKLKTMGVWNHQVVSIEPDGSEDVWDLAVAENHNFVSSGVVLHNCEGITFGAIKPQAQRAYQYVKDFVFRRDENGNRIPKPQILGDPTRERTEWKSGSSIALIVGTRSGVNSPHPQVVHADELDLMEEEVFNESRSMSSVRHFLVANVYRHSISSRRLVSPHAG